MRGVFKYGYCKESACGTQIEESRRLKTPCRINREKIPVTIRVLAPASQKP